MVLEFLRGWFGETVPIEEHRAALRCGSDLVRAKKRLEADVKSLKAKHADELASLKCAFDLSESDLAKKTHELAAANSRIADYEAAFASMEAAVASTEQENVRIKARIAEAVGLLQS